MKRMTCLWICIAILALGLPALAEGTPWMYNSLNMYLELDGTLSGDVEVPAEVNGQPVKALQYGMFSGQDEITSIYLPDSVEALGGDAISGMDNLTSVRISENLVAIENNNFCYCPNLTSVTLPPTVCYVENSFWLCDNLREIRFTGMCPTFWGTNNCFDLLPEDCVIYVPDDQLDAYKAAVGNQCGAADRMQPSGQNAISVDYTVPESDLEFDASTGTIVAYYGNAARVDIPAMIGDTQVKHIGESAFETYAIRYVVLPEGLETIGDRAFQHASNLCVIKFPSTLRTIGTEAFFNAQANIIEWNEGLEEIGSRAFMYDYEPTVTLPSTVKIIGESAFERARMTQLYLGGQVTSIGARAFADTQLKYMAFDLYAPIEIAPDAFTETSLADLDLPWDSSEENRQAYETLITEQCPDCTVWINNPVSSGIAENPINDPDITTIVNGVWTAYHGDAESLTVWTGYDDINVTALGDGLFKGNQSIRRFYPHHCGWFTTIGAEAFADSSVEYVEIFGSITTIGPEAFRNCVNMTELTLPASVTEIGEDAFAGCTGLLKLTVLCDPSILPDDAFADCASLTEVYAAADATDEQVQFLSVAANRPWYLPAARVGEAMPVLQVMPYEPLPEEDFQYYEDPGLLDRYDGYEVNLVLPRTIDGIELPTINGNMMSRASYGDNYDMELPVRSVVVPETYRELTYWGFANCETLETVVFYAPIETLPDAFFSGCTKLREVIFVNGVRYIGRNIFMNCPNLETVYLGEYVETIDEYAFTDEDGSEIYSLAQCILSADEMPDVDAMLAAVKSDPIPVPETTEEPVPVAVPVGPEGKPYLGTWNGVSMDMDGDILDLAALGMDMQITLNADGTAVLLMSGDEDHTVWTMNGDTAMIQSSTLTLAENGEMYLDEEGTRILFTRGETAYAKEPAGEDGSAFVGTWYGISMEIDGETYDLAVFGMDMQFTLNADGTVELIESGDVQNGTWYYSDGIIVVEGSLLQQSADGGLYIEEDGSRILFSRTPNPAAALTEGMDEAEPVEDEEPETYEEPAAAINIDERLEIKYVMESADMQGMNMSAAMMGGYEYSLVFHIDGTVDFVMANSPMPALRWTQGVAVTEAGEADALVIDYYGTPLYVIITEEGFDMDYFGSMLMHFVAAE